VVSKKKKKEERKKARCGGQLRHYDKNPGGKLKKA